MSQSSSDAPEEFENLTRTAGAGSTPLSESMTGGSFDFSKESLQIGRYEILSQLGRGGFGFVYKAYDPELNCEVAIKIPRWDRLLRMGEAERFREEARTLARIRNHSSIVTVYDIGESEKGVPYVVMEFVEGESLSEFIEQKELDVEQVLQIVLRISEGLMAAHQASIVHRDLKPSNVIMDKQGNITLVDFGLALHDDLSLQELGDAIEGTPAYMAPEQIRGENHRIDGQTDIWALGVITYRLLTGKHPFRAKDTKELARMIRYRDAKPPRQLNPEIPREIERICLKCLSRKMTNRYQSVRDLVDEISDAITEMSAPNISEMVDPDLLRVQQGGIDSDGTSDSRGSRSGRTSGSLRSGKSGVSDFNDSMPSQLASVTYKGLRPFESSDRDFFLQLLPGQKNRDQVPESIQFWLNRITGDELEPLTVGLIYGPSGCGKSSFIRAGLLPLLPAEVNPVYLECTPENTENRLVRQIANRINSVDPEETLSNVFRQFRRGDHLEHDDKILIVLDQFEQWLQGKSQMDHQELTEALRQCDGNKITCVLLIRDDFWLSTSQFMSTLEIPIREGQNALPLPLFDKRHARHVLTAYGRAFDRLPAQGSGQAITSSQKKFVRDAVESLSQNERVICVHLAVLAEMVKDCPWEVRELRRVGGWEGLGVQFLENLFSGTQASVNLRQNETNARMILGQLLPDKLSNIKGIAKSHQELLQTIASEVSKPAFDQTLDVLVNECPLVSVVEELEQSSNLDERPTHKQKYRLTHDFLVEPVRRWLDKKQRETWKGRAVYRFRELEQQWTRSGDRRFVPTMPHTASLLAAGHLKSATPEGRSLLKAALQKHGAACLLILAIAAGSIFMVSKLSSSSNARTVEQLVQELVLDSNEEYEPQVQQLKQWPSLTTSSLEKYLTNPNPGIRARAIGLLLQLGEEDEGDILKNKLLNEVARLSHKDFSFVLSALTKQTERSREAIEDQFQQTEDPMFRARLAITALYLNEPDLLRSMFENKGDRKFQSAIMYELRNWMGSLEPIATFAGQNEDWDVKYTFSSALGLIRENNLSEKDQQIACRLLREFASKQEHAGVCQAANQALERLQQEPAPLPRLTAKQLFDDEDPPVVVDLELGAKSNLRFVRIKAAEFLIHNASFANRLGDQAKVKLPSDVYVCCTEFPLNLFREFTESEDVDEQVRNRIRNNEFWNPNGLNQPARNIYRSDIAIFLNWLSDKYHLIPQYDLVEHEGKTLVQLREDGTGFRLTNSIEWHYAAMAETETRCYWGSVREGGVSSLFEYFDQTDVPAETGTRIPNSFGLHDMIANVRELCDSSRVYTPYLIVKMPDNTIQSTPCIQHGCNSKSVAKELSRTRFFNIIDPMSAGDDLGFRVVLPLPLKKD